MWRLHDKYEALHGEKEALRIRLEEVTADLAEARGQIATLIEEKEALIAKAESDALLMGDLGGTINNLQSLNQTISAEVEALRLECEEHRIYKEGIEDTLKDLRNKAAASKEMVDRLLHESGKQRQDQET